MREPHAVMLAVAVWLGAWVGAEYDLLAGRQRPGLSLWFGVAVAIGAWLAGRPVLLIPAALLVAVALGAHAERNFRPLGRGSFEGTARLLTDPEPFGIGTQAEVRLDNGAHVRLTMSPPVSWDSESWSAGWTVQVEGRIGPIDATPWTRSRHLVGSLNATSAGVLAGPPWWMRPSAMVRDLVQAGSRSLDPDTAALYLGLVIGDDRAQSAAQQARFRATGLGHLLAVSGQNVAFVLLVVGPALRRLGPTGRLLGTGGVLIVFAVATRLEPSVMRATATAFIAAWSVSLGRRTTAIHLLSLAVGLLILVDPFLVHAVGFQLSVAASCGMLLLAPSLVRRLPGPRWMAEAVGTTVGAQLAVLPLLLASFGPVSSVSVPANLLAGWAAGLVMTWGMSGGLVAGFLERQLHWRAPAEMLQRPVGWLVHWVDGVARWASHVPAPVVSPATVGPLFGSALVVWAAAGWVRSRPSRRGTWVSVPVATLVLVLVLVDRSPGGHRRFPDGALYWPSDERHPSVVVVTAEARTALPAALLEAGVDATDILVLERGDRVARPLLLDLIDLLAPGLVLAPPDHVVSGAYAVVAPAQIDVNGPPLLIEPVGRRLRVSSE